MWELRHDVQKAQVKGALPADGAPISSEAVVERCARLKPRVGRTKVLAILMELYSANEIHRSESLVEGRGSVTYRRLLEFNRPMLTVYAKGLIAELTEGPIEPDPSTRGGLEVFHARRTAIEEWAHAWALSRAVMAPSDEQAGVVLESYTKDLLLPMLEHHVAILRGSPDGAAIVEAMWGRGDGPGV